MSRQYDGGISRIDSRAEFSHASLPVVGRFLTYLDEHDRDCLAVAVMLVTTDIKHSRPWVIKPLGDPLENYEEVCITPDGKHLRYGVLKGATDRKHNTTGSISEESTMHIVLPDPLGRSLVSSIKHKGMPHMINRLNRHAREFSKYNDGQVTTAECLCASYWSLMDRNVLTEVEAATLAGQFRAAHGASGYYHQLDKDEINTLYRMAFYRFVSDVTPYISGDLRSYLKQHKFYYDAPVGTIGSQVEATLENFEELLSWIGKRTNATVKKALRIHHTERLILMLTALNLQNAYLYVLQLLGFGCRPIGPRSRFGLASMSQGMCVRDKASGSYEERGYSPWSSVVYRQMEACKQARDLVTQELKRRGIKIEAPGVNNNDPLAKYYDYVEKRNKVVVCRMLHTNFKKILKQHGMDMNTPALKYDNASRHCATTELNKRIPHGLKEEFMSHKISGHDYFGPWSTGLAEGMQLLDTTVNALLLKLSPRPLRLDKLFTGLKVSKAPLLSYGDSQKDLSNNTKKARPSILPQEAGEYAFLSTIDNMLDYLWTMWLAVPREREHYEMVSLLLMMADGDIMRSSTGVLSTLTYADVDEEGHICVKRHPRDEDDIRLPLPLCIPARFMLAVLRVKYPGEEHDPVFTQLELSDKGQVRWRPILKLYNAFARDFRHETGQGPPNLRQFLQVSPLVAFHAGCEPFILTALSHLPLPSPPAAGSTLLYANEPGPPSGTIYTRIPSLIKDEEDNAAQRPVSVRPKKNTGWQKDARKLIKEVIEQLRGITGGHFGGGNLAEAFKHIEEALAKADHIASEYSALHLCLMWIKYKIASGNVKASSLKTYRSRVMNKALLHDTEDSFDLLEWAPERFSEMVETRIHKTRLGHNSSKRDTMSTFSDIFRFAVKAGFADYIDLTDIDIDFTCGGARHHLIGIAEYEAYLGRYEGDNTRDDLMDAALDIIAGYGGLRPDDASQLKLENVIISKEGYVDVDCCSGKTKSARRTVPLSVMAPPDARQLVIAYARQRRSEFSNLKGRNYKDIYFFGCQANPSGFEASEISRQVTTRMKPVFGPGFVTYHLRHMAVTWSFIRWYVLRYPEVLEALRDRRAAVFSPELQRQFARYLTNNAGDTVESWDTTHMYQLVRIFGHANPTTMFRHYLHAFSFVLSHSVAKRDQVLGVRQLPAKVVSQLIPMTRSRTTLARLPGKRLINLLHWLLK